MGNFLINWGFGKKKEPIQHEVKRIPTIYFKEKMRVTLELDVEYPVDKSFYDELIKKGRISIELPEDMQVNSVDVTMVEVIAQATRKR